MTSTAGIYLHIPFCLKKCAYCDFYSIVDARLRPAYVSALTQEIQMRARPEAACDTLYFGGGTPSLLEVEQIRRLLGAVRRSFALCSKAEITIEANPATIDAAKLTELRQLGINRINIGLQSFRQSHLSFLGRCHNVEDGVSALEAARQAGFERVGADLIYGLPGQTQAAWQEDLESMLAYTPEHISCYMLTYEAGTPLNARRRSGAITPLAEGKAAQQFQFTSDFLTRHGYDHYEISNFARRSSSQDYRSRHNRKYWNMVPYHGFGPSAHSFEGVRRSWNLRSVRAYISALSQNKLPPAETETLSPTQQRLEAIYLGLRQSQGIDLKTFEAHFGDNLAASNRELLQRLQAEKMVSCDKAALILTARGMRFIDSIAALIN